MFILGWYSYFLIALKKESVMSELAIWVLSIPKFSVIYRRVLLKIYTISSLLLILLLLLFNIIDSLWKAFSKKREPTVFHVYFGECMSRTDNTVSLNFDSGAFLVSNFSNSFC